MHFVSTVLLVSAGALQAVLGLPGATRLAAADNAVTDFINKETPIAQRKLLCNIGADGCEASGAKPGIVIASPSKNDPPYFYTWTRDSALVFKGIIDRFTDSYDANIQKHIMEYTSAQAHLQGVSNPSGSLSDGRGLGEAKFNVDETAYTDAWGRPQRDGPALRATALMTYGWWLLENGYNSTARDILWPVIRNDLNYVAQYWNQTGFDLWEEVQGSSFFTAAAQYRALEEGSYFSTFVDQPNADYLPIARSIHCFLQKFWLPEKGYADANINVNDGRTGLDANTILASIHLFDPSDTSEQATRLSFQPWSDQALSNLKAVVDSFRSYGINNGIPRGQAIAVGRYIEDVYFGGNPWYLNTLAVAEQLYDAIIAWKKEGSVTVSQVSLPFFQELVSGLSVGNYASSTDQYKKILDATGAYADGFVAIVAKYTESDGSMAEQFSKSDGRPLSATDLTWSYAAFLSMSARRAGNAPRPWRSIRDWTAQPRCDTRSRTGTYVSATQTTFPTSQTLKPTTTAIRPPLVTSDPSQPCADVDVAFTVRAVTRPGQSIRLVGNTSALGNWAPQSGIQLSASDYTSNNPVWKGTVSLEAGQGFEYKYVRIEADGSVVWESGSNRILNVGSCGENISKSDDFRS